MFRSTAVAVGLVAIPACYGFFMIVHPAYEKGPRVAALQADIPQNAKMEQGKRVFQIYDQMCSNAAPKADLVVWPETCFPCGTYGLRNGASWETADAELQKLRRKSRSVYANS